MASKTGSAKSGTGNAPKPDGASVGGDIETLAARAAAAAAEIGKPLEPSERRDDNGGNENPIDPASIPGASGEATGEVRRGRGRPRKDGSAPKAKKASNLTEPLTLAELNSLAAVLVVIHGFLAMATGNEAIAIDEAEGEILAKAGKAITEHYNYVPAVMKGPWMEVAAALSQVYGTRIFTAAFEVKASPDLSAQSPVTTKRPDAGTTINVPGTDITLEATAAQFQPGPSFPQ